MGRVWLPWVDWGEELHKSTWDRKETRHTVSVNQSEPVCGDVKVTQGIHGGDVRKTRDFEVLAVSECLHKRIFRNAQTARQEPLYLFANLRLIVQGQ